MTKTAKRQPRSQAARQAISEGLRNSEAAEAYHERQTGKKRERFSYLWRARMSVTRRFPWLDKDSEAYQREVEVTEERLRTQKIPPRRRATVYDD